MSEPTTCGSPCELCGVFVPVSAPHTCYLRGSGVSPTLWVPVPDPTEKRIAELEAEVGRLRAALEKILSHTNLPAELRRKGIIADETNPGGLMYALNGCREVASSALASTASDNDCWWEITTERPDD